jgi:sortase (surface protein transpeptidase)
MYKLSTNLSNCKLLLNTYKESFKYSVMCIVNIKAYDVDEKKITHDFPPRPQI